MRGFEFRDVCQAYYSELFRHWKVATLIQQEKLLGQLIDSDLFEDFFLIDEVILLYELVRDECVCRLEFTLDEESR